MSAGVWLENDARQPDNAATRAWGMPSTWTSPSMGSPTTSIVAGVRMTGVGASAVNVR